MQPSSSMMSLIDLTRLVSTEMEKAVSSSLPEISIGEALWSSRSFNSLETRQKSLKADFWSSLYRDFSELTAERMLPNVEDLPQYQLLRRRTRETTYLALAVAERRHLCNAPE